MGANIRLKPSLIVRTTKFKTLLDHILFLRRNFYSEMRSFLLISGEETFIPVQYTLSHLHISRWIHHLLTFISSIRNNL